MLCIYLSQTTTIMQHASIKEYEILLHVCTYIVPNHLKSLS